MHLVQNKIQNLKKKGAGDGREKHRLKKIREIKIANGRSYLDSDSNKALIFYDIHKTTEILSNGLFEDIKK